ncbi:thioredoxin family protein [Dankookia sp. GCM10030260]|uniref:thioredoxin family protein n=1 Tax=Dankookia sp. GCM10030260 TaxID=3273390 RepID=UPI003616B9B6
MKNVKVLGPGCKRCDASVQMVKDAATKAGVEVTVEKVTDYVQIACYGIASTLGLVVDGKVATPAACRRPRMSCAGSQRGKGGGAALDGRSPMTISQAKRLRLDLGILLPDAPGEADACVWRLINDLNDRDGTGEAHVVSASAEHPAQLYIHYDPGVASLARAREIPQSAGAELTHRFGHVLWKMEGLQDERRARTVTNMLSAFPAW